MKQYVVTPAEIVDNRATLEEWVLQSARLRASRSRRKRRSRPKKKPADNKKPAANKEARAKTTRQKEEVEMRLLAVILLLVSAPVAGAGAVRAGRSRRRSLGAAGERAARARQDGRGGADHGPAVPAAGLGRQRADAARARAPTRRRSGRRGCTRSCRTRGRGCASTTNEPFVAGRRPTSRAAGQLLSRRRDQGRDRGVDEDAARRPSARAPTGFFTDDPPRARRQVHASCPTASSTRASWRAAALLREAAALTDAADAAARSSRSARPRSCPTTTTTATWRGWSSTRSIEPTIGPYEVYEDEWFNAKAAFEAFITVRDDAETAEAGDVLGASCRTSRTTCRSIRSCATRSSARWRRSAWSTRSSASGDANRGVQTAAFNLPNDERIANEKGTKRVMLKNVQEAKFKSVLLPIAERRARARATRRTSPSSRSSPTS